MRENTLKPIKITSMKEGRGNENVSSEVFSKHPIEIFLVPLAAPPPPPEICPI